MHKNTAVSKKIARILLTISFVYSGGMFVVDNAVEAAPALPGSDHTRQALEENRVERKEQAGLKNTAVTVKVQGEAKFMLRRINFTGQDVIDKAVFKELTSQYLNQEVTLSDMQAAADIITAYCRRQGYAVATAFIPPQSSIEGIVELRVLLGRLGQIRLDNYSQLADSQARAFIAPLVSGEYLLTEQAEMVLNNLNDLPGISAAGVLRAGQAIGETDLTITLADEKAVETALYTDNYGGQYSGRYRYGFQTTLNNISRNGDKTWLGGMLTNEAMHNYNFGYETAIGSRGSRLGIGYSQMDYTLGDYFNLLDAVGKANTFSIYGSTPLKNSGSDYVAVTYGYANRQLKDELRLFGISTKKHSNLVNTGIRGQSRGQGSYTDYSTLYYWGRLTGDDAVSAVEGSFHKFTADVNHLRRLGNVVDLQLNFHGQMSSNVLDSSEQFYLGGANGVRAYPQGEAGGDSGYQATAELRYKTPIPDLSVGSFIDFGTVHQKGGYAEEHRSLAGWGVGLRYVRTGDFALRLDYARKLDGERYQSEAQDKNGRLWFQAVKIF